MKIKKVGVIGCGLMGSGIVEVCARAGYEVVVREVSDELLQKGLGRIQQSMSKGVQKGKITQEEMEAAWKRIKGTTSLSDMAACDIAIEAAIENMAIKKSIFAELDGILPPHAILASNTSSLCVTEMASVTRRGDKVLGIHFFNPVPVMPLIEFVRTILTSDETMAIAHEFGASLGKTMVIAKDTPGFIVNRLLVPYLLDAVRIYEEGLASKEDIDTAIKLGLNHPMGPLTLLDFVGLDTTLFIADAMYEEYKDPRYAAPPLLRRMVLAGQLGRKSGKGFYNY
ncbi:MAG: 3-hydroxybutyryl-CoA dehydrogenase [Anaerolineae bacterium]|jgi:3-hydroxybutyryl-CoA dehydrogenase|nr:3-hydroxybutyryl-CoA dehydrogenase [Anaerolineae bacterium]MDH7474174.1 3-hydroxybutyryl-CoA dehydrogenase [Anaerolineae bacterium]